MSRITIETEEVKVVYFGGIRVGTAIKSKEEDGRDCYALLPERTDVYIEPSILREISHSLESLAGDTKEPLHIPCPPEDIPSVNGRKVTKVIALVLAIILAIGAMFGAKVFM